MRLYTAVVGPLLAFLGSWKVSSDCRKKKWWAVVKGIGLSCRRALSDIGYSANLFCAIGKPLEPKLNACSSFAYLETERPDFFPPLPLNIWAITMRVKAKGSLQMINTSEKSEQPIWAPKISELIFIGLISTSENKIVWSNIITLEYLEGKCIHVYVTCKCYRDLIMKSPQ